MDCPIRLRALTKYVATSSNSAYRATYCSIRVLLEAVKTTHYIQQRLGIGGSPIQQVLQEMLEERQKNVDAIEKRRICLFKTRASKNVKKGCTLNIHTWLFATCQLLV